MRRKVVLTPSERESVGKLAGMLTQQQLAEYLGISKATFAQLLRRDDELNRLYKKGRATALHAVANSLYQQAVGGNLTACIFSLKTQGGWSEKAAAAADDADDDAADDKSAPTVIEIVSGEFTASN